ncbi:hypothetical protein EHS25_000451 [Saitozyma podzolica]|uniref:U2 snRNP-associated SURP domain-containing protein n=1 Tax=Saitozyma podzolica TaxID=1890683 RepID=A0A427YW57_9TREE|nr:hypothetical protein EHS25_000451 [Saitozyma podzolica]
MSRRLDLSQFRGDDSEEEAESFVPKRHFALNELKTKTFSHGITKKSKKDLEREAEERKRKEEEEALALVNKEMEEVFAASGSGPTVGGMGGFGRRPAGPGGGFVRAGGATYVAPTGPPAGPAAMAMPPRGPMAMGYGRPLRAGPPKAPSPPPSAGPKPKGKRAMDAFLQEIKSNQQLREDRLGSMAKSACSGLGVRRMLTTAVEGSSVTALAAWEHAPAARALAEAETTNLFISNLPQNISEESLGLFFAKHGPVGTVKIMWPRGDDEAARRGRAGLTGFVSYMTRKDAEKAVEHLDGLDWGGNVIRVVFSKPVPMPLKALYAEQEKFVAAVANRVRDHGSQFEDVLRQREKDNPKFAFLFNEELPEYHLYKYSVNSRYRFPTPPPDAFDDEGYASIYSSDSAEESEKERTSKGKLGKLARRRFEAMLRVLSGKRSEIARAMEFAMTHAEAADEVAEIVCQSLRLDGTPVPRKIARLHLVSDVLHNSASPMPNVWKYRLAFERRLPEIFAHLSVVYQSLLAYSGRISADIFRQQVGAVLEIWERWIVFTQDVGEHLRGLLDGSLKLETEEEKAAKKAAAESAVQLDEAKREEEPSKFKTSGFKSSFKPMGATSTAPPAPSPANDHVDGEPIQVDNEDLDGEVIDDVDGEAMDEDLDGEAIDEDVDGEAMA